MRTILSVLLLLCLVLAGCNEKKAVDARTSALPEKIEPLVTAEMAKAVGLKTLWSKMVPLEKSEKLMKLELTGARLYAFTDRNYVLSMDSAKCDPVISFYAGRKGSNISGWKLGRDNIYSVIGSDLVELDWRTGRWVRSQRLGFAPLCPPVRNENFYYLAGPDKRLRAYKTSDFVELFKAAADDDSTILAVTAGEDMIIFGTNTGYVTAMMPEQAVKIWDFTVVGAVNAPILRNSGIVFFSSRDTYIYAIDEDSGELIWKYRTQALLKKPPVITKKYLYQNIDGGGLIALDKKSGKLLWQMSEGLDFLAESKTGTYLITKNNELVLLNSVNYNQAGSVKLPPVSKYISNTDDSKIFLADDFGRIVCLDSVN